MPSPLATRWIVITTINPPTAAIEAVARCCENGWSAVVVGDTKTPNGWQYPGIDFLSVSSQREQFKDLAELIPYRHYCRKNLGYLYAIERGAEIILETDDDNIPYDSFGSGIQRSVSGRRLHGPGWVNVYKHFVDQVQIWPRGLPLDQIESLGSLETATITANCAIQQYLADEDPDVDAIYRLTTKNSVFFRQDVPPIILGDDAWVPFNSQNTVFFREAFPLLYLPCHVSFRMTDIWRSFVAQVALSHHGHSWSFHQATVRQVRNAHDLMRDFADEVDGYLRNAEILEILRGVAPASDNMAQTVFRLWTALEGAGIIPRQELPILEAWLARLHKAEAAQNG